MTRFLIRAAAAACIAGLAFATPAAAQQAQPPQQPKQVLKATYGDWEIHCVEGTDNCAMQQVGKSDGKKALLVTVQRLANVTANGKAVPAAITVATPLGVLIPYEVRVKVDSGEVQQVPLLRCLPDSCIARAPLSEETVNVLKKGASAKFGFFLQNEVLVDISLNGFTKAYSQLTPVEAKQ